MADEREQLVADEETAISPVGDGEAPEAADVSDGDVSDDDVSDEEALAAEHERALRKRVALAQIRQYGDPVLRMHAGEVEAFDEELERTAERMVALMHDADGIGLAATQIGIVRRIFVVNHDGDDLVLVNPVLTRIAGDPEIDEEGCLSLGDVRVPVERQPEVTIDAKDVAGTSFSLELAGISARVVQHELDHLDGTLIVDRTDPEARREALSRLRPRLLLRQ
jgi:peptide deformylase